MAENIIEVGAVIDLSQILPGLNQLVVQTQATTAEMRAALEKLDAPVKVGDVVPPPSATLTPEKMQEQVAAVVDLQIQQDKLRESIAEMVAEIEKAGGTMGVESSWIERLTQEEIAEAVVTANLSSAKKALSEAISQLVGQQQLAMLIQQQMASAGKEVTAAATAAIPALGSQATTTITLADANKTGATASVASSAAKAAEVIAAETLTSATITETSVKGAQIAVGARQVSVTETSTTAKGADTAATDRLTAAEERYAAALEKVNTVKAATPTVAPAPPPPEVREGSSEALLTKQKELEEQILTLKVEENSLLEQQSIILDRINELAAVHYGENEETVAALDEITAAEEALETSSGLTTEAIVQLIEDFQEEGDSAQLAARRLLDMGISTKTLVAAFQELGYKSDAVMAAMMFSLEQLKVVEEETGHAFGLGAGEKFVSVLDAARVEKLAATFKDLGFSVEQIETALTGVDAYSLDIVSAFERLGLSTELLSSDTKVLAEAQLEAKIVGDQLAATENELANAELNLLETQEQLKASTISELLTSAAAPPKPPPPPPPVAPPAPPPEEDPEKINELTIAEKELIEAEKELTAAKEAKTAEEVAGTEAIVESTGVTNEATAANANLAASNIEAAAGADVQAGALAGTVAAGGAAAAQQKLVDQSSRDLAVSLMASGKSADEAAKMLMQAGVSGDKVAAVFESLGRPLKTLQAESTGVSAALQALLASEKAAGAELGGLARTMQLAGASGKEIAAELQNMGFSTTEVANTMAQLGIKVTGTRNELLRMATDAGATREQLEALNLTVQATTRSTQGLGLAMNESRVIFGGLDGSVGMMTSGLARVAAATKVLQPLISAAFPLFAAYALIDILAQVYASFGKLTDAVMGYTEEVKKADQENIRFSEQAQIHTASVEDAYRKLGDTLATQARIANQSWMDQAKAGADAAREQSSSWWILLGPLGAVHEAYISITGALDGLKDAADRAAKAQQQAAALHGEIIRQNEERAKHDLKMVELDQRIASIGKTKVDQIYQEMSALKAKQDLETKIAVDEAARQEVAGTAGQGEHFRIQKEMEEKNRKEILDVLRRYGVAQLEETIAEEKAVADGERTIGLARVTQKQRFAEQMYQAGTVGLRDETEQLRTAEEEKYRIELENLTRRRAIAEESRGVGKDVTPEVNTINAEIRALTTAHETNLTSIKNNEIERRKRLDEEYANTVITGERKVADEEISARREAAKVLFDQNSISESTYTSMLADEENKRNTVVETELRKRRDLINQYTRPDEVINRQKEVDDEEAVEVRKHEANLASIRASSQTRQNELERKNISDNLNLYNEKVNTEIRAEEKSSDEKIRMDDRLNSVGLISFQERTARNLATVETERRITSAVYESAIAYERQAQAAAVSSIAQEAAAKKIIELEKERDRVAEQISDKRKKIEDDLTNYLIQRNQQAYNVISTSFNSAFDKMLTEHTKFANVAASFWNQMVQGWARMGLQILANYVQTLARMVLEHTLALLHIKTIETTHVTFMTALHNLFSSFEDALGIKRTVKKTAEIAATGGAEKTGQAASLAATLTTEAAKTAAVTTQVVARTAAETGGLAAITAAEVAARTAEGSATAAKDVGEVVSLAAVAAAGAAAAAAPAGPAAMAAAATAAEAVVLSFVPQAAVFAEKGALIDKDTPAFLHKNETVLPPKLSLGFQNIINAGAFGGVNIPSVLQTPAGPVREDKIQVHNNDNSKTVHLRPNITVHVNGQQHPSLTQSDIEAAVLRGIRKGAIRANV